MSISIIPTVIADVLIIEPEIFRDDRGWFFESFNQKNFTKLTGVNDPFIQDNHSYSTQFTLRGLHYQMEFPQGKLVRVAQGRVLDVAVDIRKSSPTYGQWVSVELSGENHRQLWIPPGCAHGFLVLSHDAHFLYKVTNYWHATSEQRILWNDSTLQIDWGLDSGVLPRLNAKDAAGLSWDQAPKFE